MTGDPEQVARLVEEERPHLVLLDLMLPGTDGIELMESVPGLAHVPVIFLSAYGRDQLIARALAAGADDYVVKPFSPTELVARVQTALRRRAASTLAEPSQPYRRGELAIDYAERRVSLAGRAVPLTNIEYRLLFELSVNAGQVLTHDQLLQRVWGLEHPGRPGAVRTFVKNLRRKLDDADNPTYIFTEPRVGYRMPRGGRAGSLTARWSLGCSTSGTRGQVEGIPTGIGIPYAIIRPTLVFGEGDLLLSNMAWALRCFPVFPVFGRRDYSVQLIYAEDLAALAVAVGCRRENLNVDAAGPDTFTFEELLRLLALAVGARVRLVHTP